MLSGCIALPAQTASQSAVNPLSSAVRHSYASVKQNFIQTAEAMPESDYNFRPTPKIRSFAEVINHITNSQMHACSGILGEKPNYTPPKANDSKAKIVAALKASFAECDRAYNSLTDGNATVPVSSYRGQVPQLMALVMNTNHDNHEYGALTVYLRLKGIVPPSTARQMARKHNQK
jgi:uncharacterized damage-inducible protein DinB